MAMSTGPVLAAGGVVLFNTIIVHGKPPIDERPVFVATLIAAAGLALTERALPRAAVAMSWLILLSTLLVRVDPTTPSPIESFQQWYNAK